MTIGPDPMIRTFSMSERFISGEHYTKKRRPADSPDEKSGTGDALSEASRTLRCVSPPIMRHPWNFPVAAPPFSCVPSGPESAHHPMRGQRDSDLTASPPYCTSSISPPNKTFTARSKSHAHSSRMSFTPLPGSPLRRSNVSATFLTAFRFSGAKPLLARL